ncbi:MAG: PEP-CTERM sorting domain-containing protein [Leptospirales bacterium]
MKNVRIFLGGLSLILLGGMWSLPSQAGATSISFSSFSLVDTVSSNLQAGYPASFAGPGNITTSHSFSEGPTLSPFTDTLGQSTPIPVGFNAQGGLGYTNSNSSIQVTVAPAEDRPSQDPGGVERDSNTVVTPGIFITQTVGYTPPKGEDGFSNGVSASAITNFSGNFTGTGHSTSFQVMDYHPFRSSTGQFGFFTEPYYSSLFITVKNLTTGSFVTALGGDSTNFMFNGSSFYNMYQSPSATSPFTGPALLDFSTIPGDRYNLGFYLGSSTFPGSFANGGSITTSFVANTPEPATILLLLTGLGIVMFPKMRYRIGKDIRIN